MPQAAQNQEGLMPIKYLNIKSQFLRVYSHCVWWATISIKALKEAITSIINDMQTTVCLTSSDTWF
jgi:hypothetical protein